MRRELLLLEEMIDAAVWPADRQRRDALLWNFTVLGEAAAQLPDNLKTDYPEIPWQQPPRLRNRIVHGYWSIDLDILITTAAEHLPAMADQLRSLHGALDQPQEITNGPEQGASW
jgi:uncharacterized protein with HEPN domain